jgi:putative hydrolase
MNEPICFKEDWHVSSTFSDGSGGVEENVHAAEALCLRSLCVVDTARRFSDWAGELSEACAKADRRAAVRVRSGIEVEVLDVAGRVDLPRQASRVDRLFVAAGRLPTPSGPLDVETARRQIESGRVPAARAMEWLVRAYAGASRRHEGVVLAHPFSILPRLGIDPEKIHPAFVRWLAGELRKGGASVEVNEARRSPSRTALDCFLTAGIPVLAGTGAESPELLGAYTWAPRLLGGLSSLALAA